MKPSGRRRSRARGERINMGGRRLQPECKWPRLRLLGASRGPRSATTGGAWAALLRGSPGWSPWGRSPQARPYFVAVVEVELGAVAALVVSPTFIVEPWPPLASRADPPERDVPC